MTPAEQITEAQRWGGIVGIAYSAMINGTITQQAFAEIRERAGSVVCERHNLRTAIIDAEGQAVCLRCLEGRA